MASFPCGQDFASVVTHHSLLGQWSMSSCISTRQGNLEPAFSWTSHHVLFSFANFDLYPLAIINYKNESFFFFFFSPASHLSWTRLQGVGPWKFSQPLEFSRGIPQHARPFTKSLSKNSTRHQSSTKKIAALLLFPFILFSYVYTYSYIKELWILSRRHWIIQTKKWDVNHYLLDFLGRTPFRDVTKKAHPETVFCKL